MQLPFTRKQAEGEPLARWAEGQYKLCDGQRRKFESEWGTNILFATGSQWEAAAEDMRRYGRIPVPTSVPAKIKITSNKILPLLRQGVAVVADNIAQLIAIAASDDPADVAAAELATDILRARFFDDNEAQLRRDETMWALTCGRAMRWTYWDPDMDGMGLAGKMPGVGDIASVTLNPWRFHVSPWSPSTEKPPFKIISDIRPIEEINDIYRTDVQAEEVADAAKWLDRLVMSIVSGSEMSAGTAPKRNDSAILKRMYCEPSKKYPKGRTITFANGVLCKDTELPEGEMPGTFIDWMPIPGRAYPLPFVTPLRDQQREINVTLSQVVDLKNRQLRGDIVTQGDGAVTVEYQQEAIAWDAETGLPTKYRRTPAKIIKLGAGITSFQMMNYSTNAAEADVLLTRLWNDMMDDAGIRETSLGNTPPTGTTATQVIALKDSDHQGLAFFRSGFDYSHCQIARQKLLIAKNHYDVPRVVRTVGAKNAVKVQAFFGADLRDTEDIRPRAIPIISEAQELQARSELAAQGAFDLSGSAQTKLSKIKVLQNSAIPDIEAEIETLLGGITIDDLEAACAQINANEIKASVIQSEALVQAAMAQAQAQQQAIAQAQQAQEPQGPTDPMGQIMMLAGGAAQGQPQQAAGAA